MSDLDLLVHGVAGGGDGVATDPAGRVVFVPSAIPGDRVRVELSPYDLDRGRIVYRFR